MADQTEPRTVEVPSDSDPDVTYTVVVHSDGRIDCDCPSATYRPGRLCKHAKRILEQQEQR